MAGRVKTCGGKRARTSGLSTSTKSSEAGKTRHVSAPSNGTGDARKSGKAALGARATETLTKKKRNFKLAFLIHSQFRLQKTARMARAFKKHLIRHTSRATDGPMGGIMRKYKKHIVDAVDEQLVFH